MGDLHVMRDDLRPPDPPARRHLISIADLTRDDVERLLGTARSFERALEREMKKLPTLRGRLVINVFYESSTRTRELRVPPSGFRARFDQASAPRWTRQRSRTRR